MGRANLGHRGCPQTRLAANSAWHEAPSVTRRFRLRISATRSNSARRERPDHCARPERLRPLPLQQRRNHSRSAKTGVRPVRSTIHGLFGQRERSAITPAPGGGGTGIAYVSAAGNKWIYSVSKPPEHGKVEINQTTSTFEDGNRRCPGCKGYTYTGISTGTFTYTPNATLAESGGVAPEVGNDDIFTIRATDPNDPTIFREIDVSVDVLANNAGSVWSELFNQIEPKTNQAAIGSSIGPDPVTSKSGYVIGTGSTTPGTGRPRSPGYSPADHGDVSTLADGL